LSDDMTTLLLNVHDYCKPLTPRPVGLFSPFSLLPFHLLWNVIPAAAPNPFTYVLIKHFFF
ncbi:MAG: hypothetical protein ACFFC7_32545, partial [Candidatus Hermodarchaeota archaeon]